MVCYNNTKVGTDTLPYLNYSWDTSYWLSISEICICRHLNFFMWNDYAGPVLVIFNILQVFRGEISWNCLYDAVILSIWWKNIFFSSFIYDLNLWMLGVLRNPWKLCIKTPKVYNNEDQEVFYKNCKFHVHRGRGSVTSTGNASQIVEMYLMLKLNCMTQR